MSARRPRTPAIDRGALVLFRRDRQESQRALPGDEGDGVQRKPADASPHAAASRPPSRPVAAPGRSGEDGERSRRAIECGDERYGPSGQLWAKAQTRRSGHRPPARPRRQFPQVRPRWRVSTAPRNYRSADEGVKRDVVGFVDRDALGDALDHRAAQRPVACAHHERKGAHRQRKSRPAPAPSGSTPERRSPRCC